jgi:lipid A 3-O-deacylase
MVRIFLAIVTVSAVLFGPVGAHASDLPSRQAPPPPVPAPAPAPGFGFISELRLGGSVQDPSGPESGSFNATGEVLFVKPLQLENRIADLFIPRLHIGGSVNFEGNTSFAYAGFSWTFDVTQQFFVEATFGGALHNGDTSSIPIPNHNALGCSPLFRESASLGYRITENWSVMGTVEHLSNAGLCDQNRGLTNFGAKVGYRF